MDIGIISIIKGMDDEKLRQLIKEADKLKYHHQPADQPLSKEMEDLFEIEKYHHQTWNQKYSNIYAAITNEIINRFKNGYIK